MRSGLGLDLARAPARRATRGAGRTTLVGRGRCQGESCPQGGTLVADTWMKDSGSRRVPPVRRATAGSRRVFTGVGKSLGPQKRKSDRDDMRPSGSRGSRGGFPCEGYPAVQGQAVAVTCGVEGARVRKRTRSWARDDSALRGSHTLARTSGFCEGVSLPLHTNLTPNPIRFEGGSPPDAERAHGSAELEPTDCLENGEGGNESGSVATSEVRKPRTH